MKALLRTVILAGALIIGVRNGLYAQEADSVVVVKQDGKKLLQLNSDGGFVVRGTPEVGAIPATGTGVRMMWFPARYAFRVGKVDGFGSTYWDLANIGYGSVALGGNSRASGNHSFAANLATTASGDESVALEGDGVLIGGELPAVVVAGDATLQRPVVAKGPVVATGSLNITGQSLTISAP